MQVPDGWELVKTGGVQVGDKIWSVSPYGRWVDVDEGVIRGLGFLDSRSVSECHGVCRKIPGYVASWLRVWRDGFAPVLSTAGLEKLHAALLSDDPKLVQGMTTTPPPLMCVQDWPVEACCALGFCGWQGDGLNTVGEVEEHFAKTCFEADQRIGEPAACRWFLNWYDDTPRDQMRKELAEAVAEELKRRASAPCPIPPA